MDTHSEDEPNILSPAEERFFRIPAGTPPEVAAIAGFLKRENNKSHFVKDLVRQNGFPVWNKFLKGATIDSHGRGYSNRGNSNDTSEVIHIPFVKDSSFFVNAVLMIKLTRTDTVLQFVQDWQYKDFGFGSATEDQWNARSIFHIFSLLDNIVFGTTHFRIVDDSLLTNQELSMLSNTGLPFDSVNFIYTLGQSTTSGRNAFLSQIEVCTDYAVCLATGPVSGGCLEGKSAYRSLINPSCCVSAIEYTVCDSYWIDIPEGGGDPGGGGGDPGSGGGGGGGWTPPPAPPCSPTGSRNIITPGGCGPGWVPVTEDPPILSEPIDTLLRKCSQVVNRFRDSLSGLCESEHKERFFNIVNYNNQLDTFRVIIGLSDDEVKPNYNMTGRRALKGSWHYHPKYSDGTPGSWPSGGDVAQLYDKPNGFIMIIDTYDARYALVVENADSMAVWKNILGNGPKALPDRLYQSVLSDPRAYSTGSTYVQMTKEKLLEALGNSAVCGIGLYQASSANGTTFTKVN